MTLKKVLGITIDVVAIAAIICAIGFPFVVYFRVQDWLSRLAASNPVADQGAMVWGFLLLVASVLVSIIVIAISVVVLLLRRRRRGKSAHPAFA